MQSKNKRRIISIFVIFLALTPLLIQDFISQPAGRSVSQNNDIDTTFELIFQSSELLARSSNEGETTSSDGSNKSSLTEWTAETKATTTDNSERTSTNNDFTTRPLETTSTSSQEITDTENIDESTNLESVLTTSVEAESTEESTKVTRVTKENTKKTSSISTTSSTDTSDSSDTVGTSDSKVKVTTTKSESGTSTKASELVTGEEATETEELTTTSTESTRSEPSTIDAIDFHAKNIYVYDIAAEKVVFEKDAKEQVPPASLVKLMTVYLTLENIDDRNAIAPVDSQTYQELVEENSSMAGFFPGEETSYRDLLYGTMLPSGGEAANSLAVNVAGSKEKFVAMMNAKAKELGLLNSSYKTPEGLDADGQYMSAEDVAKLLLIALKNPDFRTIFTTHSFESSNTAHNPEGVLMYNTVLHSLKEEDQVGFEIIGGKSGTTYDAGLSWATLARKNNKEYLVIVMGVPFSFTQINNGQKLDTLKILELLETGG